jgi:hypothetical protein
MTRKTDAAAFGAAMFALLLATGAGAQQPEHGHGGMGHAEHYDARYSHNHYYANRGVVVHEVPGRPYAIAHSGTPFYYSGGVWYAPHGPSFVVVAAPVGVFVPVLPPFYTTLWFAGVPYHYANDTYYVYRGDQQGYEVVDPPADSGAAAAQVPPNAEPPANADDLYVYPQNGQSADQQARDKYECHRWAFSQTGFDPTQPATPLPPEQLDTQRAQYQRAMRACLEGRAYSVR